MHGAGAGAAAAAATAILPGMITSAQRPIESRIPPPSYAEAMAQSASVKNNASTAQERYERYPQVPAYSQPMPGHPGPSNFYPNSCISAAAAATRNSSNAQNHSAQQNSAAAPIHCIVHTEHVVHRKSRTDRASNKIIWAAMLGVVIMIVVVRTILVRSGI